MPSPSEIAKGRPEPTTYWLDGVLERNTADLRFLPVALEPQARDILKEQDSGN